MNTLESSFVDSPYGKTEECAKFIIDNTSNQFVLHDITSIGQEYTLTIWVKSDMTGSLYAAGNQMDASTEWQKHTATFVASSNNLGILFQVAGTYYIYHPQLEIGNTSTDWTPSPEDMAYGKDIESVHEEIAQLVINSNNIFASVTESKKETDKSIQSVNDALGSTNGLITDLTKEVSAKMTSEAVELQIKTAMENGTSKVVTNTGFTFDDVGMTVEKSGSEMKTQITEDGMTVYQNSEAVLTANNQGVDAKNLHATTYLIIGQNSRFEDYGSNRTGCFWIGD